MQSSEPVWKQDSACGRALRVLLWLETGGRGKDGPCAWCGIGSHGVTCGLSAALTSNGLSSHAERNAAREEITNFPHG